MPRAFTLTDQLLLEHRSGRPLLLATSARGRSFSALANRPAGFEFFRPNRLALVSAAPAPPLAGPQAGAPGVAVIRIRGLLESEVTEHMCGFDDGYDGEGGIVDRIREAAASSEVGALVVDVLSPGGDAAGCGEGAAQLAAISAATTKPILVFAREANSAAYWLTAAVASPGCFLVQASADVGCIGCWNGHADESDALAMAGVKIKLFQYPDGKTAGNSFEPLSDEGAARFQASATEHGARFVAGIAALRGLTPEAVLAFRGRSFRGEAAIAAGLADGTAGSLDEVIALAAAYAANPSARGPMPTRTPPARPASAAEPPPAEAKPSRYAEGDPVTIIADNVVGTITSTDCYEVMVEGEDVPRRCLGDELEPVEVAAAPAAQSRTPLPRSFAAAVAHASGLSAGASDAAARLQAAAMLGLAAAVLAATGKKDADSALGVLDARFAAAAQVPELRRQLAAKSAQAEAEAKTAADHAAAKERSALLEQAIALGTAPALVYETTAGAAGEKVLAETAWAKGQTNAQLAAFVETSKGLGGFALAAGEKRPDVSEDGAISAPHLASLTADERAYCAQTGRDPALFARTKSTLFGAKSAGKEA